MALPSRFWWVFFYFSFFCKNTNEVGEINMLEVHNLIENTQDNHQNNQFWSL